MVFYRWLRKNRLLAPFIAFLLFFRKNTFFRQRGWLATFRWYLPVDAEGKPIPWYTYAAIDFLGPRIKNDFQVFEYGSGNSTRWWSSRAKHLVSCEHDQSWYEKVKNSLPGNVTYVYHAIEEDGAYAKEIQNDHGLFDIVVIDGRDRVNCSRYAKDVLSERGIIIWDNSDREKYQVGCDELVEAGFKRIDFTGVMPVGTHGSCTSVFYREGNCLDI